MMKIRSSHALAILAISSVLGLACQAETVDKNKAPACCAGQAADPAKAQELPAGHPTLPADHPALPATGASCPTGMPGVDISTANKNDLVWSAPASWKVKTGNSMRKGSYSVSTPSGETELAITAFPGSTGGLDANLNRWRGQVGLPPLSAAEVVKDTTSFAANNLSFTVVDYAGPRGRMLGTIVAFKENSWFFKLTGSEKAVGEAKEAYLSFLRSVKAP